MRITERLDACLNVALRLQNMATSMKPLVGVILFSLSYAVVMFVIFIARHLSEDGA